MDYWNNTETWRDRAGNLSRLEDLPRGHRKNIIRMVHRQAKHIRAAMEVRLGVAAGTFTGDMAQDAIFNEQRELDDMTDVELVESLPLIKRLRELNELTGVPEFRVTFGTAHNEDHAALNLGVLSEGWVTIEAPNEEIARGIALGIFGPKWAFLYEKDEFHPHHYTQGELLRLAWTTKED